MAAVVADAMEYKQIRRSTRKALERDVSDEVRAGWMRVDEVVAWSGRQANGKARVDYTQTLVRRSD